MRILLITDWTAEEGGIETYLRQLRAGLEAAGDDVRLLVSDLGTGARKAEHVARGYRSAVAQSVTQLLNPSALRTLHAAVARFRPDVAHVSSFELQLSPLALRALGRTPFVHSVAWYKPRCPTGHKLWPDGTRCLVRRGRVCLGAGCLGPVRFGRETVRYALVERAAGRAAEVVACSEHVRAWLRREGVASVHVPWPVAQPAPAFRRSRARSPLFVAAGRISREKGLETLVGALADLRGRGIDARARLVGDGPSRGAVVARARALGVEGALEVTGWLPHAEVERHLTEAWALVAPSLWAEPLGLSAVEAILRGVPVVASAEGGYAETVVPGRTGLLFPNGDAAALAARLAEVATGEAFAGGVDDGEAAALATRHRPEAHVASIRRIFGEVAG